MNMSSRFTRGDLFVVLLILAILIFLELTLRITENRLSGNIRHVRNIPELVQTFVQESEKPTMLLLGNSLLNDGVDQPTLESELSGNNILKINPDGSSIWVWYYLYKNMIAAYNTNPDYLFVHFAWGQLSDNFTFDASELGHFFCKTSDLLELRQVQRFAFGDQAEFLIAHSSYLFADREAISKNILDLFIPDYRATTQRINNIQRAQKSNLDSSVQTQKEYFLLSQFMTKIRENNVKAVFVSMPVSEKYEIDDHARQIIFSNGMYLMDCREVPGLTREDFKDAIHLKVEASRKFSQFLANKIKQELPFSLACNINGISPVPMRSLTHSENIAKEQEKYAF